jgi:hypothetical protein
VAEDAAPDKLPTATTEPSKVGLPCLTCAGKKRTLCVRSNRKAGWHPQHWGHADLALTESNVDGTGKTTTTYGNWPAKYSPGSDTTLKSNYEYDLDHKDFKYVRCKEISDEQTKKLQKAVEQNKSWNFYNNNCSTLAGSTWKDVTGESLYYGQGNPFFYDNPADLGSSIINANGGQPSNFTGNF